MSKVPNLLLPVNIAFPLLSLHMLQFMWFLGTKNASCACSAIPEQFFFYVASNLHVIFPMQGSV